MSQGTPRPNPRLPQQGPSQRPWDRLLAAAGSAAAMLALVGAVALLLGLTLVLLFPELHATGVTLLIIGAILLLAALVAALRSARIDAAGRWTRYGANTTVMVVAFVAIAVLANFLAARGNVRVDLTATRQFTLAPQTTQVLAGLQQPVEVTAFFRTSDPVHEASRQPVEDMLAEFRRRAGSSFTFRFVDPDLAPDLARAKGASQFPVLVFETSNPVRRHRVPVAQRLEQSFLTAILIVTGADQKRVYLLTGHGQRDFRDDDPASPTGFGLARLGLQGDNYAVQELNLTQQGAVPEDAAAVVVAGPTKDLQVDEAQALHQYLEAGGRMVVLLEPNPPQTWRDFLARWGLQVLDGFVVDPRNHVLGDPRSPLVDRSQYAQHTITRSMDATYYPGLAPVDLVQPADKLPTLVDLAPLAFTSVGSFATADPQRTRWEEGDPVLLPNAQTLFFPGVVLHMAGPVGQAAPGPEDLIARLAVFGDSDFASNKYFYPNNGDLFLNTVNHLTGDVALIAVRPKPVAFRQLVMTAGQFAVIRYASWFLLPLLVTVAGAAVWWRRR